MLSILILVSPLLAFVAAAELFYSDLQPCPAVCEPGSNLSDWTFYHDVNRLAVCDQPVLLDFNVYTPVDDPCTDVTMRACTVANTTTDTLCDCDCEDASSMETSENVIVATRRLQDYLRNDAHSSRKILFAAHRGSLVGVYLGPFKYNESRAADTLMPKFVDNIKRDGVGNRTALQICSQGSSSDQVLGIAADAKGDFAAIQSIMKSWDEAQCITGDEASDWDGIETWSVQDDGLSGRDIVERSIYFDKHDSSLAPNHRLGIRADCRTLKVLSGDTCTSLASKCGVEAAAFTRYNSNSTTLCSSLQVGQAVCCSAGTLPDIKPKPQTDGTCAVHTVESNEYCQSIAASYGLSLQDLDDFNKETWGWLGCDNLQVNTRICVSTGNAPMPAPVSNAVCGPIVPGTKAPAENQSIADLNPCILNACCNVWGQCGTTAEFCTETASVTGNPGTSEPGANGCMHSCGTDIVNNGTAPSQFRKIGYFEAWNLERDCLQMHVARIKPAQSYTHVHFAFAQISTDFQVVIASNLTQQWDAFRTASSSYKKVLAFGGWSFSTDYDTRAIFAQGVSASNRALFADRVVQFVAANGLDGLDFDWEYPGATDIPGAPAGHKDDGNNYLEFLKLVRAKLPSEKTLSIAIPASFWYLRGFPVAQLADVVDYVVYMTYDLHGQWDAGNQWSVQGCPQGSCLRSHVNYTETYNSLSMLTKAGFPTHKIVVGVSSYGRSFKMTSADCRGPTCAFQGGQNNSPAKPGRCTGEAGILANAEILEIIDDADNIAQWHDDTGSDSDFLVYQDTEWVAYMSDTTKANRAAKYQSLNLGGVADWAIDLQEFLLRGSDPQDDDIDSIDDEDYLANCDGSFDSLDQLAQANAPLECGPQYVLPILRNMLQVAVVDFNAIMADGYDKYFGIYAQYAADNGGTMLHSFMNEHGNEYFSCNIIEEISCCNYCYYKHGNSNPECRYCTQEVCNDITSPWGPPPSQYHNVSEPCPPDMSQRGIPPDLEGEYTAQSIFWSLQPDREQAFWDAVTAEVPAPREKIVFQPTTPLPFQQDVDFVCATQGVWAKEFCQRHGWWFNAPAVLGLTVGDIVNPKDTVSKALNSATGILPALWVAEAEIRAFQYNGSGEDVVDAAALPVFMVQEAVEHMRDVVSMGREIEEQEKKLFIATLLMAIFFVIPLLGEGLGALGMGTLGRVFAALGELGDIGQDIYGIVDDPKSAPLAIFGLIAGGAGLLDAVSVRKAAEIRRGMSPDDIAKLGSSLKTKMDQVEQVVNKNAGKKVCIP